MNKGPKPNTGLLRFFVTARGRKIIFTLSSVTTLGLFAGNFLPHTVILKYYKEFVQCYSNGVARPLTDAVAGRVEQAMDLLGLDSYERRLIKPFTVLGFDIFQAGSTKYRFGSALGIPVNYNCTQSNELKHNDIRFRTREIDWSSEAGKRLEASLILTADEQLFGLCKSILQLQTHYVLMNAIFPSVSFLAVYSVGSYINHRLDLFARPLSLRLVLYSIMGLFGVGSWVFMKDYNQVSCDADIDKELATMGPRFVTAGIGYYDKQLQKNIALRTLMGDDTYTAKGNVNYFLRQESMPLTMRKAFFEQKLQELKEGATPVAQASPSNAATTNAL